MLLPVSLLLLTSLSQTGAESARPDEARQSRLLEPLYQEQASNYEFYLDQDQQAKLDFVAAPVMRWTAEGNSGAVWVWTRQGRAELIGCLGSYIDPSGTLQGFHEFHALTLEPLQPVEVGGVRKWAADRPGVTLKAFEESPEPAATDRLRLIQMRNLAREFTASLKSGERTSVLRLTPSPLYRYRSTNPDILDGAIFSYLWDNGTDPEFILLLEARKSDAGMQWHYAPVRFTWREVWLMHGDREVWRALEHNEFRRGGDLHDSYVTCETGAVKLKKPAAPAVVPGK